jgi:fumarate hydratase class II
VGTGINTHPQFAGKVCADLAERTGLPFQEAENHPEAQAAKDADVEASGELKTVAISLSRIANDIRWLGSGPRCGLGELALPAIQPGSSIMPGKVNPVICESVVQAAARVEANDRAVASGGFGGVGSLLELNVAMPLIADALMASIRLLHGAADTLRRKVLEGLAVNRQRCADLIEQSLMMVTSLAPAIGYDNAAKLAKRAFDEDRTIRELVREQALLDEKRLDELLDPRGMTEPTSS